MCAGIDDACWGGGEAHVLACTLLHDMKRNETKQNKREPNDSCCENVFFFWSFSYFGFESSCKDLGWFDGSLSDSLSDSLLERFSRRSSATGVISHG